MFDVLLESLNTWNAAKSERQKLQHTLICLAGAIVLIAGIVSLFNAKLGHDIVRVALFAVAVFFANALVWNLLQSSLLSKLSTKSRRR
jgi:NADH:ubiquinone oxidoreductase subunit 6 (subunit J)